MRVAVIGAGWAGCAAAVTLARLGASVTLFETAAVPGGRARRVTRNGLVLDNGQHLLLGAYTETRRLLAVVHADGGERGRLARLPLTIEPIGDSRNALSLRARRWPAPFGLAAALCLARGLSLGERFALIGWWQRLARAQFQCPPDTTVAQLLESCPTAAARSLWEPLSLAALNTPAQRACGQIFANVLRAAFASETAASDFLLPTVDLSALFPEAAARYVERRGGEIRLRTRASVVAIEDEGIVVRGGARDESFDAAVVAVGPHQLVHALAPLPAFADALDSARALAYEPIATIWLGYGSAVALAAPIVRLDDAPGQWALDRHDVLARGNETGTKQLIAVVVSASGPHETLDHRALALACDAQLRRLVPGWPPLLWSQVIVEQRATYACVPGRVRPATALPHPRVALAGDWIDAEFPATLEAAVRTGVSAARSLHASCEPAAQASSQDQNAVPSFAR